MPDPAALHYMRSRSLARHPPPALVDPPPQQEWHAMWGMTALL
eukprot:IDg1348t1